MHAFEEAWSVAQLKELPKQLLIIASSHTHAHELHAHLRFLRSDLQIQLIPDWELLPFDTTSPHAHIIADRIHACYQLLTHPPKVVIISAATALQKTPPPSYYLDTCLHFELKQRINREHFLEKLIRHNYERVSTVRQAGQFALRGSLIDLFSPAHTEPLRIELEDDEIVSIRCFDPESQLSTGKLEKLSILPGREYPHDSQAKARCKRRWRNQFGNHARSGFYTQLENPHPEGMEFYLSLAHEDPLGSWFDYLHEQCAMLLPSPIDWPEQIALIHRRHEWRRLDTEQPPLPIPDVYLDQRELEASLCQTMTLSQPDDLRVMTPSKPLIDWQDKSLAGFKSWLQDNADKTVALFIRSPQRRRAVLQHLALKDHQLLNHWSERQLREARLSLVDHTLPNSYQAPDGMLLADEKYLFGGHDHQHHAGTGKHHHQHQKSDLNWQDLDIDQLVAHERFGIGRYRGIKNIPISDLEQDYLMIEYANADMIYVPVHEIDQITPYQHHGDDDIPLHALGSKRWQTAKEKAWKKAYDYAANLLQLYAQRQVQEGISYPKPEDDYIRFCAEFEHELTNDQDTACRAILADMTDNKPMDRLVCGDVGFGKTEVAMRAAFIAAHHGKQVAVLVPTTVLAQQHAETFYERFANWPIHIRTLTRMSSSAQQKTDLDGIALGSVDIVIGTHRLLSNDIKFSSLGLVIIDEEHRFGVKDKERLKQWTSQADILSLSATPIPRSLNMALGQMRDFSIIATAPVDRQNIATYVRPQHDSWLIEAISRERQRGGQIYYVLNDIARLTACQKHLTGLFPDLTSVTAHGQMPARQLEKIMAAFYEGEVECLITTTIIESGINIPRANTILIERADRFGLAQLHQLRGRVGRSHQQGYAYLLTPAEGRMLRDAKKRLEAITRHTELGAGFRLAMEDLEIRGGGELLGKDQSGHVDAVGMSLYTRLLGRAIQRLQNPESSNNSDLGDDYSDVQIPVNHNIPESYIEDITTRIQFYRQISQAQTDEEVERITFSLHDRFGPLPDSVKQLFLVNRIRKRCEALGIEKLHCREEAFTITIAKRHHMEVDNLTRLLNHPARRWRLKGPDCLTCHFSASVNREELPSSVLEALAELG